MDSPPLSFRALAQSAGNPATGGYPYQIRGDDLDKCFVAATAIYEAEHFENTESLGLGGHMQPKVSIKNPLPDPPVNEFRLLGGGNNSYSFLASEKPGALITWVGGIINGQGGGWSTVAPEKNGQIPFFYKPTDGSTQQWGFLSPGKEGELFYWNNTDGRWNSISPAADGQMIVWDNDQKKWILLTPGDEGAFPQWDAVEGWENRGAGTQKGQFLKWDSVGKNWVPFSGGAEGSFPQWDATDGWSSAGAGTANGELLRWNSSAAKWEPFGRGTAQNQLLMWGPNGWQQAPAPPATGKYVFGSVDGALGWIATEEC